MTDQNRCEENISFVNSFFQLYSGFRADVVKDLQEKTNAFSTLLTYVNTGEENLRDTLIKVNKLEQDLQKLMSEMIRLANIIESRNKEHIKQIDAVMQINAKPQPDKNIWDWLKEFKK